MDVLSDVLEVLRLSGVVFFNANLSSPWRLSSPPADELVKTLDLEPASSVVLFHVIAQGQCELTSNDGSSLALATGDAVVFPRADQHVMGNWPLNRTTPAVTPIAAILGSSSRLPWGIPEVSHGGGGDIRTRVVCGFLHCDQRFDPLFQELPACVVVRANPPVDSTGAGRAATPLAHGRNGALPANRPARAGVSELIAGGWLRSTMEQLVAESNEPQPGCAALIARLTEAMFFHLLRQYVTPAASTSCGWLGALRDPVVGKAIGLMHKTPAQAWTVEELGRQTGVSRSVIAERFTQETGQAPMQYLATWRMQLAGKLLRHSRVSIAQIAAAVGYESEASFHRAFKKRTGCKPGALRRAHPR